MNQVTSCNQRSILQICMIEELGKSIGRFKKMFLTRPFGSSRKQMSQSKYNYSLILLYNLKENLRL